MLVGEKKFLVGIVDSEVLDTVESDSAHRMYNDMVACSALEIRYDFFDENEWPTLSSRVRKIAPNAMQVGTIRLKRDGGNFPDDRAKKRLSLWQSIFGAVQVPDWIDLEFDCRDEYSTLNKVIQSSRTKILVSQHDFARVPAKEKLEDFANEVMRVGAPGLKIAAMCNSEKDCELLYSFVQKFAGKFSLFAAFGMGDIGRVTRIWSLKEGANLTYGSIGRAAAPGLLEVPLMDKALNKLSDFQFQSELSAFLSEN